MTTITSTKIRNFRFLTLRCSFLRIEYQSNRTHEKIIENINEKSNGIEKLNGKIVRKNVKCGIGKIEIMANRNGEKVMKKNRKIDNRKLNRNCKCNKKKIKLDRIEIGLRIVEKIVRIGSALSGLLPSIRQDLTKRAIVVAFYTTD